MKTKSDKSSRNLMIACLLGDGSISKTHSFRMCHGAKQTEYLAWKIKQLHEAGIRTCGIKESTQSVGYAVGTPYVYTRLSIVPFVKTLRRIVYKPTKVFSTKLLNRIDERGLAIWYMDDGCLNHRRTKDRKPIGFYVRIATCTSEEQTQLIIDYFLEKWNISFYRIKEGKGTFSICCGTTQARKFIDLVKPFVTQVPSLMYKITTDFDKVGSSESKHRAPFIGEDIV